MADEYEVKLAAFRAHVMEAAATQRQCTRPSTNLTPCQEKLLKLLRNHPIFIACNADKNLGICLLERVLYIQMGLEDHLLDEKCYKQLTPDEAWLRHCNAKMAFSTLVDDFS